MRDDLDKFIASYETISDFTLRSTVRMSPCPPRLVSTLYTLLHDEKVDTCHIREKWEED